MSNMSEPKKRIRRKKTEIINGSILQPTNEVENIQLQIEEAPVNERAPSDGKKRGRKPKGGKLLPKTTPMVQEQPVVQNVILHLKCSTRDLLEQNTIHDPLKYNNEAPPDILTYSPNDKNTNFTLYTSDDEKKYAYTTNQNKKITETQKYVCSKCENNSQEDNNNVSMQLINQKLKKIKLDLYKNNLSDKQSACFWCTYEFDNPPCYIPKYEMDGEMCAYGSFCRPECAVAYLMKENVDDSTKFERYQFINQVYGKVYDYKRNIRPAPNPHFLLEKFYGNMTIQEYRKLLNSDHMLSVIEKPLTRILPELHEDNDDYNSMSGKQDQYSSSNQTSGYKVRRKSEKQSGPTKSDIMRNHFGITA